MIIEKNAVVLLSGGLDSMVCLATVLRDPEFDKIAAITFSYGQTTFPEIEKARTLCRAWGVPHKVIEINLPFSTDSHQEIPARNLIFVSLATGWAIENNFSHIVIGAEPDSTYTDSSLQFLEQANKTLNLFEKTLIWPVKLLEDKKAMVITALNFGVPLHLCHSSLGNKIDGKCKTSKRYIDAVTSVVGTLFPFEKLMEELNRLQTISEDGKVFSLLYKNYRMGNQETLSFKLAPALFCLSAYEGSGKDPTTVYSTGNWSKAIKYVIEEALDFGKFQIPDVTYVETNNIPLLLNQKLGCGSYRAKWGLKQALSLLPRPRYAPRLACRVVQGHLADAARNLGYKVVSPKENHDILLLTDL